MHTYNPNSGTNKQDDGFNFDLVRDSMKILLRVNDYGITGTLSGSDKIYLKEGLLSFFFVNI